MCSASSLLTDFFPPEYQGKFLQREPSSRCTLAKDFLSNLNIFNVMNTNHKKKAALTATRSAFFIYPSFYCYYLYVNLVCGMCVSLVFICVVYTYACAFVHEN